MSSHWGAKKKEKLLRFGYKVARALLFYPSSSIFPPFSPSLDCFYGLPLSSPLHISAPLSSAQTLTQTDLIGLSLFEEMWTYLTFSHRFRPKNETKHKLDLFNISKVISDVSPLDFQKRSQKCLKIFSDLERSAIKKFNMKSSNNLSCYPNSLYSPILLVNVKKYLICVYFYFFKWETSETCTLKIHFLKVN